VILGRRLDDTQLSHHSWLLVCEEGNRIHQQIQESEGHGVSLQSFTSPVFLWGSPSSMESTIGGALSFPLTPPSGSAGSVNLPCVIGGWLACAFMAGECEI
jgi:hypothetical protein